MAENTTPQHCPGYADFKNLKVVICKCTKCGEEKEIFSDEFDKEHICKSCDEPIDFIGVNYAVDDRRAADEIFPIAEERGIAVLVYVPFGRTRLWQRVGDREVPEWAGEIGIKSWGQFFIKYAAAHPAVTVVTPATSKPHHMLDNIGAAVGELPDKAMQKRMAEYVDALPSA